MVVVPGSPGRQRMLGLSLKLGPQCPGHLTTPAVLVLGLPLHWSRVAGRAGTGRGAADPLGELTVLLILEQREEKQSRVAVGVGTAGPLPTCLPSKALEEHGTPQTRTRVPCTIQAKIMLHTCEPISSSSTSCFHTAFPGAS